MTITRRTAALALAASSTMPATAALAQNTQDAAPVRGLESLTPQATPVPVPPAPLIVLPSATPTPTPRPASRPVRTPTARSAAKPEPTPTPTPEPKATAPATSQPSPSPTPAATPTPPVPQPIATQTPVAPAPTATAAPTAVSDATPQPGRTMPLWLSLLVVVVVGVALWVLRRPRRIVEQAMPEPIAEPVPEPVAQPIPVPVEPRAPAAPAFLEPAAAPSGARLAVELRPLRAGLNMLSAVADCELTVTNTGDAPAEGIRAQVSLLTAHAGLDADLAALATLPIGRPTTPPFTLAPGESRVFKAIAAAPRDAIRTMQVGDRPMFVPVVAANLLYPGGQTTRAWAVGIERVDSAKLAPFWLDAPPRMYDGVAARPHQAASGR